MKKILQIAFLLMLVNVAVAQVKVTGTLNGEKILDTTKHLNFIGTYFITPNDSTANFDSSKVVTDVTKINDSTIRVFKGGVAVVPDIEINGNGAGAGGGGYTPTDTAYDVVQADGLGPTTVLFNKGFHAKNTTAAINGTQQMGPFIQSQGNGYNTAGTPGSKSVSAGFDALPVQGTTLPTGIMRFGFSINGAALTQHTMHLTSGGNLIVGPWNAFAITIASLTGTISSSNALNLSPAALSSGTMMTLGGNTHSGNITSNTYYYYKLTGTHTGGTGSASQVFTSIEPVINLTGTPTTGFYTALKINATETTINSGVTNWLVSAGTGGTQRWGITNTGQGVYGTSAPDASAKVDIQSTTQGFLLPRMTSTQGSAISSPANGLMIYVTDTNGTFTSVGFWGRENGAWIKL